MFSKNPLGGFVWNFPIALLDVHRITGTNLF